MNYHYFGSTAFDWATGDTREEVIRRLAGAAGASTIKRMRAGMYAWTCRVELPGTAAYAIRNYAPKDVSISDQKEVSILSARGTFVDYVHPSSDNPYTAKEKGDDR